MKKWCKVNFAFIVLLTLLIHISFISAQNYTLKVTEEHPFFVGGKWLVANQLKIGDELTTADGKKAKITYIEDVSLDEPIQVYNLEALPFHDFVVDSNVVVHNSNNVNVPKELYAQIKSLRPSNDENLQKLWEDFGKCNRIIDKKLRGEPISIEDKNFMSSFLIRLLKFQELTNKDFKVSGDTIELYDTDTPIGRAVRQFTDKNLKVLIDPLSDSPMIEPQLGYVSFPIETFADSFIFSIGFVHEYGHMEILQKFIKGEPLTAQENARLAALMLTKKIRIYEKFITDEFMQLWGDILNSMNYFDSNEEILRKYCQDIIKDKIEVLSQFAEEGRESSGDFRTVIDLMNTAGYQGVTIGFDPNLYLAGNNIEIVFYKSIFQGRTVIEVMIYFRMVENGPIGSLSIVLSDPAIVAEVTKITDSKAGSDANKQYLINLLNQKTAPQLPYLSESSKHTLVAMVSLSKEIEYYRSLTNFAEKQNSLCAMKSFLARYNLAKGFISHPIGLQNYYNNLQSVPRVGLLPSQ